MHKLLQDMARNIVRKDSKDPAEHSRVWRHDECKTLLRNGNGSKKIEGLVLKMRDDTQGMGPKEAFKTSSLIKMKNLKFLHLRNVKLTRTYKNFPDLRWLKWERCFLKKVPAGLLTNCLVALHMKLGDLEEFNPPMVLNSLKFLDLSRSYKLVSICNLHRLPKLEELGLNYCTSLSHVCKTIGYLKNLSLLSLAGCTRLWKDLSNQKCVNQLERLKALCICGGTPQQPLFALPQSLSTLILSHSSIEILPHYADLKMLQSLSLNCCPKLKSLYAMD
ncbi:putative leucine-rich repeat domain superfamily [Helianthus anomalus]